MVLFGKKIFNTLKNRVFSDAGDNPFKNVAIILILFFGIAIVEQNFHLRYSFPIIVC